MSKFLEGENKRGGKEALVNLFSLKHTTKLSSLTSTPSKEEPTCKRVVIKAQGHLTRWRERLELYCWLCRSGFPPTFDVNAKSRSRPHSQVPCCQGTGGTPERHTPVPLWAVCSPWPGGQALPCCYPRALGALHPPSSSPHPQNDCLITGKQRGEAS